MLDVNVMDVAQRQSCVDGFCHSGRALVTCCVPDTMLGARDPTANKPTVSLADVGTQSRAYAGLVLGPGPLLVTNATPLNYKMSTLDGQLDVRLSIPGAWVATAARLQWLIRLTRLHFSPPRKSPVVGGA